MALCSQHSSCRKCLKDPICEWCTERRIEGCFTTNTSNCLDIIFDKENCISAHYNDAINVAILILVLAGISVVVFVIVWKILNVWFPGECCIDDSISKEITQVNNTNSEIFPEETYSFDHKDEEWAPVAL